MKTTETSARTVVIVFLWGLVVTLIGFSLISSSKSPIDERALGFPIMMVGIYVIRWAWERVDIYDR